MPWLYCAICESIEVEQYSDFSYRDNLITHIGVDIKDIIIIAVVICDNH